MQKHIALIAHDSKKQELIIWAEKNKDILSQHVLYATGTTGNLLEKSLDLVINKMHSGPLGGDLEVGALITQGKIDFLIFFWDPLQAQPHDPDVKALLRVSIVWNIPLACNQASADYLFTSNLLHSEYQREVPEYNKYLLRKI